MTSNPQGQFHQGQRDPESINVGSGERIGSIIAGGMLVMWGLKRRSTFGALIAACGGGLIYVGLTGHCNVYDEMGIDHAHGEGVSPAAEPSDYFSRGIHVEQSVTVDRPAAELFRFWRNFENLPQFMQHLETVKCEGDRSHWVAKGPAGSRVHWDAQIINEEPEHLIAWRSVEGADVDNAGSVRFIDNGRGGTDVRVVLDYLPPAGQVGQYVAKLFGEAPEQQVAEDLQNFKRVMEQNVAQASRR
jgi:uncharacterized membrane protein